MDFISQIIDEVVESVVEERWLPIYKRYEVSNLGRIKSFTRWKNGKILKPKIEKDGYWRITLNYEKNNLVIPIHRLVLQAFNPTEEDLLCDHINHIKNDNRLCNLRWATHSQNTRYHKKFEDCSSQHIGVSFTKANNKWRAVCSIDGKLQHIGYFDDEHDAGRAYNEFIIKHNLQDFTILNQLSR